jgi:hypothetical protein
VVNVDTKLEHESICRALSAKNGAGWQIHLIGIEAAGQAWRYRSSCNDAEDPQRKDTKDFEEIASLLDSHYWGSPVRSALFSGFALPTLRLCFLAPLR